VRYLTLDDVLALHDTMMRGRGEAPVPLRGGGLAQLESAVMRPQMAAHYADADLYQQAALLAVGISQALALMDGNERTGFYCAAVFLRQNAHPIRDELRMDFARRLEAVAEESGDRSLTTDALAAWLRSIATQ
jgi:prophage maintenance system killer protein